jgi:hypothetical protein
MVCKSTTMRATPKSSALASAGSWRRSRRRRDTVVGDNLSNAANLPESSPKAFANLAMAVAGSTEVSGAPAGNPSSSETAGSITDRSLNHLITGLRLPLAGQTHNPVAVPVGFAQGARTDGATCGLPGAAARNDEIPCSALPKNAYGHKDLLLATNHAKLCLVTRRIRQFMAYTAWRCQRHGSKDRHGMPYFQPSYARLLS